MKKIEIETDGTAVVTETHGDPLPILDKDGHKVGETPQVSVWRARGDQAEKHLPTWNDETRVLAVDAKGTRVCASRLSSGDVSAIRDAANETRKQRDS